MSELCEPLREFTASLPPILQWLAVMLAGSLPFVESYYGSVIGVVAGVPPLVAVSAAVTGNIGSTLATVAVVHALKKRRTPGSLEQSFRSVRLRRLFEKYGIPGVSLGGQTLLPSQITAATLVGLGVPGRKVIVWQVVSITAWGLLYGTLATLGVGLLT